MKYSTDSFFNYLYASRGVKSLSQCETVDDFYAQRQKKTEALKLALGVDRLEGCEYKIKAERISEHRYEVEILPELIMPMWVLRPEHGNGKNVLYLHGHDEYGAKGSFNYYGQDKTFHKWLPLLLKSEGYTVVIPELIGFGELQKEDYTDGYKGCYSNAAVLQLFGMSVSGMRAYQARRVLDVMRDIIERPVSFICGISGGAHVASMLMGLGVKAEAFVLSNYGASYRSSFMKIHHCIDNYVYNILNIGECSDILGIAAPAPVMLTNGAADNIFPQDGIKETADGLSTVYRLLGAEEAFVNHTHSGGHETDSDAVIAFLKKYTNTEE